MLAGKFGTMAIRWTAALAEKNRGVRYFPLISFGNSERFQIYQRCTGRFSSVFPLEGTGEAACAFFRILALGTCYRS